MNETERAEAKLKIATKLQELGGRSAFAPLRRIAGENVTNMRDIGSVLQAMIDAGELETIQASAGLSCQITQKGIDTYGEVEQKSQLSGFEQTLMQKIGRTPKQQMNYIVLAAQHKQTAENSTDGLDMALHRLEDQKLITFDMKTQRAILTDAGKEEFERIEKAGRDQGR